MTKLTPLPFEAVQAQSEWLLEQFDKGVAPDGTACSPGRNYPGSSSYTIEGSTTVTFTHTWTPSAYAGFTVSVPQRPRHLGRNSSGEVYEVQYITIAVTVEFDLDSSMHIYRAFYNEQEIVFKVSDEVYRQQENSVSKQVASDFIRKRVKQIMRGQ